MQSHNWFFTGVSTFFPNYRKIEVSFTIDVANICLFGITSLEAPSATNMQIESYEAKSPLKDQVN